MSYCRHNGVTSDLYLYKDVYGGWQCVGCGVFFTIGDVLKHLEEHKAKGDKIPQHTFERVQKEIDSFGIDWDGE